MMCLSMSKPLHSILYKLVKVTRSLYCISFGKIKKRQVETDWFDVRIGLRKEDVLSHLLFIVLINQGIYRTHSNDIQQIFAYADYVAEMKDTIDELQDVAKIWLSSMHSKGIKFNTAKGKTQVIPIDH